MHVNVFFFCMLTYLIKITLKDSVVIAILRLHMSEKRSVAKIKYLFLFGIFLYYVLNLLMFQLTDQLHIRPSLNF